MPSKAFSDCYVVLLDGNVVGWVEEEIAPLVADSLRTFKVFVPLAFSPVALYSVKESV